MRVLVTGGTGFIGRHLCEALAARGDTLVALVRTPSKAALLPDGAEVLEGDLTLFAQPDLALPEVDVVVHLAAVIAADSPEQYEAINFIAVEDLVACLDRQAWTPKRLVFASSIAAMGPSGREAPIDEDTPCRPVDPYGEAKMRAEAVVASAAYPTTSFRPGLVFGPHDEATKTLYETAQRGFGLRVAGAPRPLSLIDVRDLVDAIIAMIDDNRPGNHTYAVVTDELMDDRQLCRSIASAMDRRIMMVAIPTLALRAATAVSGPVTRMLGVRNQLDAKQLAQMLAPGWWVTSAKLQRELDWAPKYTLEQTFAHAVAGYREAGVLR